MEETFRFRLSRKDRLRFERSAKAQRMSLAAFLREAAHEKAGRTPRRAACLDYKDNVELSTEAEKDPRKFIREKLKERRGLYR
jgi:hypothetical protein